MRRWHSDLLRTIREWRKHRRGHTDFNKMWRPSNDPQNIDCQCDEQPGRFRKHHAFDCGNPQCQICHSDKYPKRKPTLQEIKAHLNYKEQQQEHQDKPKPWFRSI